MNKKVFVIILNYNGKDTLLACLRSVFRSRDVNFSTVVVDNASTDGSFEAAKREFPRAHFILNSQNLGFAAGNNVGIRFALEREADYVFLLNNDAVLEPDALSRLVECAEQIGKPSVLCPIITDAHDRVWYAGARLKWWRMRSEHIDERRHTRTSAAFLPTEVLTGCAVLIDKRVFAEIGLLNESYFLYYEDADFSFCARRAGFVLAVVPFVGARHAETSELPEKKDNKTYWLVLSALLFFHAHAPAYLRYLWYPPLMFLRKLKNRLALRRRVPGAENVARAYRDYRYAKRNYTPHC